MATGHVPVLVQYYAYQREFVVSFPSLALGWAEVDNSQLFMHESR